MVGPVGPAGAQGPAGPAGPAGPEGPRGPEAVRGHAHKRWDSSTNASCCNTWTTIQNSDITLATSGGPVMIIISVSLNGGSHGTCRPIVDGAWAATFAGEDDPGTYWPEGLVCVGGCTGGWRRWDKTRVYTGIPAGLHTFQLQCSTDGGTMTVGGGRSQFSVLELGAAS